MWMDIVTNTNTGIAIMVALGAVFNAIGIWLTWSMKQIWILHDPERSLITDACDFWEPENNSEEFDEFEESTIVEEDDTEVVEEVM